MPQQHQHPDKRTVYHMPLALHSASRQFSENRLCAFALVAVTDVHLNVMRWRVFLENWKPSLYDQTREEIACNEYRADQWLDALLNYCNRCYSSGLDAGYDFHVVTGLGGKE